MLNLHSQLIEDIIMQFLFGADTPTPNDGPLIIHRCERETVCVWKDVIWAARKRIITLAENSDHPALKELCQVLASYWRN